MINKEISRLCSPSYKDFRIFLELIESGEDVPLTGSGNSMRPFLRDEKDVLIMTSPIGREIATGDVVLYQRDNGQLVIHRVYKRCKDGTFCFVGDNQWSLERNISPHQFCAVAKKVVKEGKAIDCERGLLKNCFIVRMYIRVIAFKLLKTVKYFLIFFLNMHKKSL